MEQYILLLFNTDTVFAYQCIMVFPIMKGYRTWQVSYINQEVTTPEVRGTISGLIEDTVLFGLHLTVIVKSTMKFVHKSFLKTSMRRYLIVTLNFKLMNVIWVCSLHPDHNIIIGVYNLVVLTWSRDKWLGYLT